VWCLHRGVRGSVRVVHLCENRKLLVDVQLLITLQDLNTHTHTHTHTHRETDRTRRTRRERTHHHISTGAHRLCREFCKGGGRGYEEARQLLVSSYAILFADRSCIPVPYPSLSSRDNSQLTPLRPSASPERPCQTHLGPVPFIQFAHSHSLHEIDCSLSSSG
jgi:hypothetical protein